MLAERCTMLCRYTFASGSCAAAGLSLVAEAENFQTDNELQDENMPFYNIYTSIGNIRLIGEKFKDTF